MGRRRSGRRLPHGRALLRALRLVIGRGVGWLVGVAAGAVAVGRLAARLLVVGLLVVGLLVVGLVLPGLLVVGLVVAGLRRARRAVDAGAVVTSRRDLGALVRGRRRLGGRAALCQGDAA